jgi:hypothetical protein
MGEYVGAAVLSRNQLERWTYNVAHHFDLEQEPRENLESFMSRVWDTYPVSNGNIPVGQIWAKLSEFLHGRESAEDVFQFDLTSSNLQRDPQARPPAIPSIAEFIVRVCDVANRQIRGGIAETLEGSDERRRFLQSRVERKLPFEEPDGLWKALAPLDHFVALGPLGEKLVDNAQTYRYRIAGVRSHLRRLTTHLDDEFITNALLERRGRAAMRARLAFREEEKILDEGADLGALGARLFRFIATAECSLLAASWVRGPERDSLTLAANALRSAWILWLEDTDMSLPCMRTVLEQTCRARVWRTKPNKAGDLETRQASPIRWVEHAGWSRLRTLVKAFGEFSHMRIGVRIDGARDVLTALQDDPAAPNALQTGRGHALDASTLLLAHEVATRLAVSAPELEVTFRQAVTLMDSHKHESMIENLLARGLVIRDHDFGEPTFRRVPK